MKRKIGYSEPVDYFPKEIRDKYFKTDNKKPAKPTPKKKEENKKK